MIVKVESISHTKNALAYCERGGELLAQYKCFGNSDDIYQEMLDNNALNERCTKPTFHIKLRPANEDQLNNQQFLDIAEKYAKEIGFHNNPYAVYIHEENTQKAHIHIVASRIKSNNTAVSDSFLFYKNLEFSKVIEKEYGLRQVERPNYKNKEIDVAPFISKDKRKIALVENIESSIKFADSLEDFIDLLKVKEIKVKIGRGIGFTDADGVSFKGSALGRQFSLSGIRGQINKNNYFKIKREPNSIKITQENTRPSLNVSNSFLPDASILTPIINGHENNDENIDELLGKKKKKKKTFKM